MILVVSVPSAFSSCSGLTNLIIGTNVTEIGLQAFYYCKSLTRVIIPGSVAHLGGETFLRCTSLTEISVATNNLAFSSMDGVLFDKDRTTLIQYPGGKAGSYVVPGNITGW